MTVNDNGGIYQDCPFQSDLALGSEQLSLCLSLL